MGSACSGLCQTTSGAMAEDSADQLIAYFSTEMTATSDLYSPDDMTLLHLAAMHDRFSIVRWLLSKGQKLTMVDGKGRTPLHVAVEHNSLFALREMLQYEFRNGSLASLADVLNRKTANGRTTLDLCQYKPAATSVTPSNTPGAGGQWMTPNSRKYSAIETPGAEVSADGQLADSVDTARFDGGTSEDDSGMFEGDTASEGDLDELSFVSDGPGEPPRTPNTARNNRRKKRTSTGTDEQAPDDVLLESSGEGNQEQQQDLSASMDRTAMSEPLSRTGVPSLQYLLACDFPPSTHPRRHSPAVVHHLIKTARRYLSRTTQRTQRSAPILEICATGLHTDQLVPHAFLGPSMFLDRRIRLAELTQFITARNLDKHWDSILPDVNFSFRAAFGAVLPDDPSVTPRQRKRKRRERRVATQEIVMTPLLATVYCGSIGALKQLVILGGRSQIMVSDSAGNTAVHYAVDNLVRTGKDRMLRFVLQYLKESEELLHKTNNNGHRPGEFNAAEAAELHLPEARTTLHVIPSTKSFHRRRKSLIISNGVLGTVPSASRVHGASPDTAPLARNHTKPPKQESKRTVPDPGSREQIADRVDAALVPAVMSEGSTSEDDDDDLGTTGGGTAPGTGAETAEMPALDTNTTTAGGDPEDAAGSPRRAPKKNTAKQQPASSIPGSVPNAEDDLSSDAPDTDAIHLQGSPMVDSQSDDDAAPPPRSPALGNRDPDSGVLPCLRKHELRKQLKLF